jgi:hypothetical protein
MVALLSASAEAVQLAVSVVVSIVLDDVPVAVVDALNELETPNWATVTLLRTQV